MSKPVFPVLEEDFMRQRLLPPRQPVRLLIDTDAANEIDDQFALAWALLSPEHMRVDAVTAEPFSLAHHKAELIRAEQALENGKPLEEHLVGDLQGWIKRLHKQARRASQLEFVDPAKGMELSYQEILTVYNKLEIDTEGKVFRGANHYMQDADTPVMSDAVSTIIDLAKSGDDPLYIAAMGCVTNIASALLKAPEIVSNIVVIWTSAYPSHAPYCNRPSFNLVQDVHASRLLYDCGVPLVYLPGYHVGAQLKISLPEIQNFVKGKGAIGDYLYHLFINNPLHTIFAIDDTARRTWVIWDIIDIAWLINSEWIPTRLTSSPILDDELCWRKDDSRHLMLEAYDVQRDEIFIDLYNKLSTAQL